MASIRTVRKTKRGVYKRAVIKITEEITFGIGYVDTSLEASLKATFDMLESTLIRGDEPNQELQGRLGRLPAGIRSKLILNNLMQEVTQSPTLDELVSEFADFKLADTDPRSVRNYCNALKNGLLKRLGGTTRIDAIGPEELIRFVDGASREYKDSTVANQIKRARMLFRFALDRNYISGNYFDSLRVANRCSRFCMRLTQEREATQVEYMTETEIQKLLDCRKSLRSEIENAEWDALIWLLRYHGGRVSSYLILRWEDIDFTRKVIRLRMKQTDRQAYIKGHKKVVDTPLFWQLTDKLLTLKKLQAEGSKYLLNVIGNLGDKPEFEITNEAGQRVRQGRWETNLSTTFKKILKRNRIPIWSQPFHAFRSYRAAELARDGATELQISQWVGNSPEVRKRFYSTFHLVGSEVFTEPPKSAG